MTNTKCSCGKRIAPGLAGTQAVRDGAVFTLDGTTCRVCLERTGAQPLKAYREAVANLAYDAHRLDYYARVTERFGKPERFYSED